MVKAVQACRDSLRAVPALPTLFAPKPILPQPLPQQKQAFVLSGRIIDTSSGHSWGMKLKQSFQQVVSVEVSDSVRSSLEKEPSQDAVSGISDPVEASDGGGSFVQTCQLQASTSLNTVSVGVSRTSESSVDRCDTSVPGGEHERSSGGEGASDEELVTEFSEKKAFVLSSTDNSHFASPEEGESIISAVMGTPVPTNPTSTFSDSKCAELVPSDQGPINYFNGGELSDPTLNKCEILCSESTAARQPCILPLEKTATPSISSEIKPEINFVELCNGPQTPVLSRVLLELNGSKKNKKKELYSKADTSCSDTHSSYKLTEEKLNADGFVDTTESSSMDKLNFDSANVSNSVVIAIDQKDQYKAECDNCEVAANASIPNLSISENRVLEDLEKKIHAYSRTFLLSLKEQYKDLPNGFEVGPNLASIMSFSSGTYTEGLSLKNAEHDSLKKVSRVVPPIALAAQLTVSAPGEYAGGECASFLQFGTITPGIVKAMQARRDSLRAVPALPTLFAPKSLLPHPLPQQKQAFVLSGRKHPLPQQKQAFVLSGRIIDTTSGPEEGESNIPAIMGTTVLTNPTSTFFDSKSAELVPSDSKSAGLPCELFDPTLNKGEILCSEGTAARQPCILPLEITTPSISSEIKPEINHVELCNGAQTPVLSRVLLELNGSKMNKKKEKKQKKEIYSKASFGGDRPSGPAREDRHMAAISDGNRWNKSSGLHMGHMHENSPTNYRTTKRVNSGIGRNSSDLDRWQRPKSIQRGMMPSPQGPMQVIHKSVNRYEIGRASDEEEKKQRRLKAILNKLTPQNFEKLLDQVKEVNIDNAVTLTGVIAQIFDKALMEPNFCEMYADFCFHLATELPDIVEENQKITFRSLLLNKCQEEFERGEREQAEVDSAYEEGEIQQTEGEREEKRIQAHRRMLGNIRLIGELYKKKMLTDRIMHECINNLLGHYQSPNEENIEALCKLMSTIGELIDHVAARKHMDAYFDKITVLSTCQKLSSRLRFMLKDTIDLRKNKWRLRRKVEGPKKIEDVHKDAAQERQAQTSKFGRRSYW